MLAFTTTMMCTWESAIPFFMTAFLNGAGVSMIYGYILAFIGALATGASITEMASMLVNHLTYDMFHSRLQLMSLNRYPISGGQYHVRKPKDKGVT